jgi:hypothetical protein
VAVCSSQSVMVENGLPFAGVTRDETVALEPTPVPPWPGQAR